MVAGKDIGDSASEGPMIERMSVAGSVAGSIITNADVASVCDSEDASNLMTEEDVSAPFLTSIKPPPGKRSISQLQAARRNLLPEPKVVMSSIDVLPNHLLDVTCDLPESAPLDQTTAASTSTILFDDRAAQERWQKHFNGAISHEIIKDAFWWTVLKFFHTDNERVGRDDLLEVIYSRLARNFVQLFLQIDTKDKDLICDNYHDALAQTVFYLLYSCFPASRDRLGKPFRLELAREFSQWMMGPLPPRIDMRHWKLRSKKPPKAPVRKKSSKRTMVELAAETDAIMARCLKLADDESIRASERVTMIKQIREDFNKSIVPINAIRSLETFGNSDLVARFLNEKTESRFTRHLRVTRGAPEVQKGASDIFMRKLKNYHRHEQTRQLQEKMLAAKEELSKEELQAVQARKEHRRQLRDEKIEARKSRREFVAGVLKAIEEECKQGLGVSKHRTVSDATRAEFKLGPGAQ